MTSQKQTNILQCHGTVNGPSALSWENVPMLQQMGEVAICKHTFFLDVSHGDIWRFGSVSLTIIF